MLNVGWREDTEHPVLGLHSCANNIDTKNINYSSMFSSCQKCTQGSRNMETICTWLENHAIRQLDLKARSFPFRTKQLTGTGKLRGNVATPWRWGTLDNSNETNKLKNTRKGSNLCFQSRGLGAAEEVGQSVPSRECHSKDLTFRELAQSPLVTNYSQPVTWRWFGRGKHSSSQQKRGDPLKICGITTDYVYY